MEGGKLSRPRLKIKVGVAPPSKHHQHADQHHCQQAPIYLVGMQFSRVRYNICMACHKESVPSVHPLYCIGPDKC